MGVRVPFSLSAHEKPVFVVSSLSLGLCHVLEINDRNYGRQNTHYNGIENRQGELGEHTLRVVRIKPKIGRPLFFAQDI